jgi:hypothetical protein
VSDVSFLPEFGRDGFVNPAFMGNFDFASADNNFFYVVWGDSQFELAGGNGRNDSNEFFDRIAIRWSQCRSRPASLCLPRY